MKGAWFERPTIKGVRPGTKRNRGQTVHSSYADKFCIILFVRMFIVGMFLRQKTQDRVLGQSAGVPCKVASGLRSQ